MQRIISVVAVLSLSALAAGLAMAEDRKAAKSVPAGVWARKGAQLKIEFADKDVLKLAPHGDSAVIEIVCKYTLDKDGVVKAKITEFEGKDELKEKVKNVVPIGKEFRFKWKAKDDAATLEDLQGDDIDTLRSHLEGEYEAKK